MRNKITIRFDAIGIRFMNPTTHKWQPTDHETAGKFVRNVLDYPRLRHLEGGRARGKRA